MATKNLRTVKQASRGVAGGRSSELRRRRGGSEAVSQADDRLDPWRELNRLRAAGDIAAALEALDAAFKAGDRLAGLAALQLAAANGLPIPRRVASWLDHGIGYYIHQRPRAKDGSGRPSLDHALGISGNDLRKQKDADALVAAMGRMLWLQVLGATADQAATLVASLDPSLTQATLCDRYRRSGRGKAAREVIAALVVPPSPEETLAEYPADNYPGVREAKAAIRAEYAKRTG